MKHSGLNLKKEEYSVSLQEGASRRALISLIKRYHYTGSCSTASVLAFSLSKGDDLVGAALFMAQRKSAAKSMFNGDHKRVLCLSRLAIHPDVPRNGASFFLASCLRQIGRSQKFDCVTPYADTRQGHSGTIYKAANFEFLGATSARPRWVDNKGRIKSRKQGRIWRSRDTMHRLGFKQDGSTVKLKFRYLIKRSKR